MTERNRSVWLAFAAGCVATLAAIMLYVYWRGQERALDAAGHMFESGLVPRDLKPPTLPESPRIPDAPIPVPK